MTTAAAERESALAAALERLTQRLSDACGAAGRSVDDVQLLPVTKFFPASDVEILYGLGCREFGESREQEASAKVDALASVVGNAEPDATIRWHMIGHLQRNKAKSVARWAYAIHSVDSARLVRSLDKATAEAVDTGVRVSDPLRVLVQVSLDGDLDRGGVAESGLSELTELVSAAPHLELAGLMAIPPLGVEPERAFAHLARIHESVVREFPGATQLSAGMSNDLEEAVKHGSTCVRVGTALMGDRPITSH